MRGGEENNVTNYLNYLNIFKYLNLNDLNKTFIYKGY